MDKYKVVISWSDDDNAYIAQIPELPGCMADGPTREAALEELRTVFRLWVEMAQRLGNAIPEPRKYAALSVAEAPTL